MTGQMAATWSVVGLAVAYLAWRIVGTVRALGKGGCGGGCGCAQKGANGTGIKLIAPEELTVRRR